MFTRRTFLQTTAAALAARSFAVENLQPLVGSQLYGWGQYYERDGKKLAGHMEDVLSALRDAGYDYAEGSLSGSAEANVKSGEQLRARGLKPVSLYTGGTLHDAAAGEATVQRLVAGARGAKEAGYRIVNCNPDSIGRHKTDEELATQAGWLRVLGDELAKLGMQLGVHHHAPEMGNGAKEYHANFRQTDARTVGFCYDVHWVFRGGVLPADALRDYGARIVSWHLRQSRDKVWWEDLDAGDIDYPAIAAHAKAHALAPYYTVELALEGGTKITRTAVENHARSRDYVRRIFGA